MQSNGGRMTRDDFYSLCHNSQAIKHEAMRDVAFIVIGIDENATHYKLRGHWLNVVGKPNYLMGFEEIEIKKTDTDRWVTYETKD
jgi:hypothetical protein